MALRKHELILASFATIFLLTLNGAAVYASAPNPGAAYLPSYSIYGAPSAPSNVSVLNDSAEYWGPYMNTIYVTWFTTSEALVEATVNGYVQFDSGGVGNVQQYNQLQPYTTSGLLAINISAANSFGYIGFNTNVGLTSNVHFRRALQHLTNYATETQALDNGILGIASPYYLYPAIYGSYFGSQEAAAYQQHGAFSLTAAEQELEAAGLVDNSKGSDWTFANGTAVPALNVLTSTGPGLELEEASIEAMTDNAAAINLTINIEPVNFYTIIDSLLPSGSFQMYFLGWSLGTPVSPTWFYYIFGDYPLNTYYQNFQNTTMWNEFNDLLEGSSTQALAQQYATTSADELQNQLPYIILDWGTSLTPVNVQSWKGYTLEAPYGVLFPGEVHPTGSTFGSLYRFGTPQNPDTLNLYVATSLYDFQILNLLIQTPLTIAYNDPVGIVANAAYNYSIGSLDGKDPNGHPVNGTTITMNFNPNVYFADGVPLTAADYNFTLWWLDMGGFSSNPWNPSQDTVTIDPGVVLNYTAESANPALEYFGEAAGFVDSYVPPSNPYQLTIYFNTTSIFNLNEVYSEPILPEHIFASISPTAFASETTGQYLAQEVFAGSYTLNSYSPANSYAELQYNPAAFLASPLAVQMNAVTGSTAAFSMTADTWNGPGMTSSSSGFFGDYVPINGASGTLYVMNPTTLATIASYPLTAGSNGQYTAQIPTGSLAIGSYTLDAQLSWTGPSYTDFAGGQTTGNTYYYHQYSTLNVTPVVSTTTTTSQSSVATISTASFSSSFSTTSAPIITTTSGAPTTTTTTSSNSAEYLVLAIIIVAVVIMIVALIARRGPKSSAPASNTATM